MSTVEATEQIVEAMRAADLGFADVAERLDKPKVWVTAALLGQHPMTEEDARTVAEVLSLDPSVTSPLTAYPMRGSLDPKVPTDPTIYRLYEVLQVYGPALKALIHEEFGDGIMSAIAFNMDLEREPHDGGDRVKITMSGKFLPYSWG